MLDTIVIIVLVVAGSAVVLGICLGIFGLIMLAMITSGWAEAWGRR